MGEFSYGIKLEPLGRLMDGADGDTIMDILAREGLPVQADCGSTGVCGKCVVMVDPASNVSPLTENELDHLTADQVIGNYRLACQSRIHGALTITIPEQFIDTQATPGKTRIGGTYPAEPLVERIQLPKSTISPDNNVAGAIVELVAEHLQTVSGQSEEITHLRVLQQLSLPSTLRGDSTVVIHRNYGVTAIVHGTRMRSLGLAVDIGTTTVAVYLCDMKTGDVLATSALANPQRRFGEDVISRIVFVNKDAENIVQLQDIVGRQVQPLKISTMSSLWAIPPCRICLPVYTPIVWVSHLFGP